MSEQDCFQSQATVFILENREWKERGSGLVKFVFDLKTYALILVNNPNTKNEFSCRLKPRIRSKGPRAYVIRAESSDEHNGDKMILAVRFEREKDSQSFRRFVERRPPPRHQSSNRNHSSHNNTSNNKLTTTLTPSNKRNLPKEKSDILMRNNSPVTNRDRKLPLSFNTTETSNPTNTTKHQTYFWSCPTCMQMNDSPSTQCQVCGARKPTQPQGSYHTSHKRNSKSRNQLSNNTETYNTSQILNLNSVNPLNQSTTTPAHTAHVTTHNINIQSINNSYSQDVSMVTQNPNSNRFNSQSQISYNNNNSTPNTTTNNYYNNYTNPNNSSHTNTHTHTHSSLSKVNHTHNHSSHTQSILVDLTVDNLTKLSRVYPPKRRNCKEIISEQIKHSIQQMTNHETY